ncbi:MAG: D-cysteine desulfhydrase family protein [Anaerolineaceae bacterium]|jgi:D-cysteine desulfhydrase|nr:MAG: D-cysteine desulfhydrase family protein [Anaerolineaceae bacterium]
MPVSRLNFAHLPTPIEELQNLSHALGGPRILVKRDDQTGLAFGGNKTRKLEFLIAEARDQGADLLISGGAMQSNHCRQTAAAAARYGFECKLVLTGEKPKQATANLLLDQLFGAEIITVEDRAFRDQILQKTFDDAVAAGKKPYLVPYGGSSPAGAMGYAFAMEELMKQINGDLGGFENLRGLEQGIDWIVFGTSSGGTHAGLVLGQRLFGYKGKVLGISIDEPEEELKSHVSDLASRASEKLGERINFSRNDVLATEDYCQAGYGVFGEGEREAIRLFAKQEGLLLDPVYTGRAAAGMIDLIRNGFFKKDETVLFWHTGGQPALFADKYSNSLL